MQKEYSTAVLNGPKLDQSSAQNLTYIKVQKDIVIQYSRYTFDILLILAFIFDHYEVIVMASDNYLSDSLNIADRDISYCSIGDTCYE